MAGRPRDSNYYNYGYYQGPDVLQRIQYPVDITLLDLYEVAEKCNAVRKAIQAIRDYIFKEGIDFRPKFGRRCRQCFWESPPGSKPDFCGGCGMGNAPEGPQAMGPGVPPPGAPPGTPPSGLIGVPPPPGYTSAIPHASAEPEPTEDWFDEPDEKEKKAAEKFFRCVNRNRQDIYEALKMYEWHLNVADDSFLVAVQDYEVDTCPCENFGKIVSTDLKELIVADPKNFLKVEDNRTMRPGGKWWICLRHRPTCRTQTGIYGSQIQSLQPTGGTAYQKPGICEERVGGEKCGLPLHDVWYVSHEPGNPNKVLEYYIGPEIASNGDEFPGEVIYGAKHLFSYGYGLSPLIAVFDLAKFLMYSERYMRKAYELERTPRAALFIGTRNPKSVQKAFKEAEDKNRSQEGHWFPKFTYDPGEHGQVQVVDLFRTPKEMDMGPARDEAYRRIGAALGVAPVFQGNVEAAGLQNQGPTQWQVTSLAAEISQEHYNRKVFVTLGTLMSLHDWDMVLNEVEERNEIQEEQIQLMKVQRALSMQQLGFSPTGIDENGDFSYPSKPAPQPMGGMGGGAMGMTGPGGAGPPQGGIPTGPSPPRVDF